MVAGSCLCGGVSFEIDEPGIVINLCQCTRCRKASGSAFSSTLHIPLAQFRWRSGEQLVTGYESRPFCSACGSRVPHVATAAAHVTLPAGLLDADPQCRPVGYLYESQRVPWWSAHDDLPHFDTVGHIDDQLPHLNKHLEATANRSVAVRPARDSDFDQLLALANQSLPDAARENAAWLDNRRRFDESRQRRFHHVAFLDDELAGYAAAEEGPETDQYRWFIVVPRSEWGRYARNLLYQYLWCDAREAGARRLWVQEEAEDPLVEFVSSLGFSETRRFRLENGRQAVRLDREAAPA